MEFAEREQLARATPFDDSLHSCSRSKLSSRVPRTWGTSYTAANNGRVILQRVARCKYYLRGSQRQTQTMCSQLRHGSLAWSSPFLSGCSRRSLLMPHAFSSPLSKRLENAMLNGMPKSSHAIGARRASFRGDGSIPSAKVIRGHAMFILNKC